jgi:hypothetical protein
LTANNQPPKLIEVFTEEPSQQITPLPEEERAEPPVLRPSEAVPATTETPWLSAWSDVGISIGVWVASVVLLLIVPLIYALPYLIWRIVKFGPPSPEALQSDKLLLFYSVIGILPTHLLTFVIVWLLITYGGRRPFWKNIDFDWPSGSSPMIVTLVSALVATLLFLIF